MKRAPSIRRGPEVPFLARGAVSALFILLLCASPARAAVPPDTRSAEDLATLSLEELSNITVTSVSGRAERLSDAAASVYVVTNEDIRRSGVSTLPEALRLAPNLEVARSGASSYAISARGFNSSGNKLLVLIDGRAVYTPLFSGVFWDAQDVALDDVDRIEVISGPGATLWGANAVNGVINVITRRAQNTQGSLASVEAGTLGRGINLRHGGTLGGPGAGGAFRVYGKFQDTFNTNRAGGVTASDGLERGQVGFRADWGDVNAGFTLQGDAYRISEDQAGPIDAKVSGGNLLARWTHSLVGGGRLMLQGYFDNTERNIPNSYTQRLNTVDLSFQHNLGERGAHAWTWGGGHRSASDHLTNSPGFAFLPADKTLRWTNLFAQDQVALASNLRLTVGAKLERNPFSGTDVLPSVRLGWTMRPNSLLWGALSRAIRAPSRLDRDLFVPATGTVLAGGPDFRSEISNVAEIGYRAQPSSVFSYSVSLYHNRHSRLRSVEPTGTGSLVIANRMLGHTTGVEAWGNYQATSNWRVSAGGLVMRQRLRTESGSGDLNAPTAAGNDPPHQWSLRSSLDLAGDADLDVTVRHVAALPNPSIPAYTAVDVRYAWALWRGLEMAVIGQNILDAGHSEFGPPATRTEIARGIFLKLSLAF